MIIPVVVMQASIFVDYWGDFADNTWAVHVHYWIATAWYVYLVSQPWLYAHGRMSAHRTLGILGIGLAGAFAFTAISQLNRDLVYANFVAENPGGNGPFEPWFFLGVAISEIILISAFMIAVIMAVIHRKIVQDHSWWLISTAFIVMMPALARGLQAAWIAVYGFGPDIDVVVMSPIYVSQSIIIAMVFTAAAYLDRLRHPATYLAVAANSAALFLEPLGRSTMLEGVLRAIINV
jgi:hypothetical protein